MTNQGKPRRTSGTRFRPEMDSEDPADHDFVDIETEGQADLLGNPLATPRVIAAFHFNNRVASKSDHDDDGMQKKSENVAHAQDGIKLSKLKNSGPLAEFATDRSARPKLVMCSS